jgi:hypothetical protein
MKGLKKCVKNTLLRASLAVRPKSFDGKVFCIGFNKTGATSVGKALRMIDYRHSPFNRRVWRQYECGALGKVIDYTSKFDSCDDLPWLKEGMIPMLDKYFPGSKYVYLGRDEESWKKSYERWTIKVTGRKPGVGLGWVRYCAHRDFVNRYFAGREGDLLTIRVSDSDAFEKLARFLGKTAPAGELPCYNRST